jgi:hypothetical protein
MKIFLFIALTTNSLIGFLGYRFLNKSRLLFSDRFGFIVALTGSGIVGLVTALNLFLLFPSNFTVMSVLNLFIGIAIGIAFGAMLNTQSLIAGFFNGGVGGMMGTMIGAVALDPSICGLPPSSITEQSTLIFFGLLSFILVTITFTLLCFALRV